MAVTLSRDELKRLLALSALLTLLVFLVISFIRTNYFNEALGAVVFQTGMASISFSAFALFIAVKMKWTRPWLAWLARRPIVHGVWWGQLKSSYQGKNLDIPIAFVVKQTYISLSIQSFTDGISADSVIEVFDMNQKNDDVRLKYVYEMKREANREHKFTTGYGDLKLQDKGTVLDGFYWTNSPTEGSIRLKLVQRDCKDINCFDSARRAAQATRDAETK